MTDYPDASHPFVLGNPNYRVTPTGEVWSIERRASNGLRIPGKLLKQRTRDGYKLVALTGTDKPRWAYVHVLVLEAFVGSRPAGQETRHLNGDPGDNRLENLQWGTSLENAADTRAHGTHNNQRKTHCNQGHEFTTENTYVGPDGRRQCRVCRRRGYRRIAS